MQLKLKTASSIKQFEYRYNTIFRAFKHYCTNKINTTGNTFSSRLQASHNRTQNMPRTISLKRQASHKGTQKISCTISSRVQASHKGTQNIQFKSLWLIVISVSLASVQDFRHLIFIKELKQSLQDFRHLIFIKEHYDSTHYRFKTSGIS